MVTVPRITPRPVSGAGNQVRATPDDFGAGIAFGLEKLGSGAVDLGVEIAKIDKAKQLETDQAELLEANNRADELGRRVLLDPDAGYLAQTGRAAADSRDQTLKLYNQELAKIGSGLSRPELQNLWQQQYRGRRSAFETDVHQHALKQANAWKTGEREGRIANATVYAASHWQDPQRLAVNIGNVRKTAQAFATEQGYGAEQAEAFVRGRVSTAHFAAVQQMLAANDVVAAAQYGQKHRDEFSAQHLIAANRAINEAAVVVGGQFLGNDAVAKGKAKVDPVGALLVQQKSSDTLFSALVQQESGGDASAISKKGAAGLA